MQPRLPLVQILLAQHNQCWNACVSGYKNFYVLKDTRSGILNRVEFPGLNQLDLRAIKKRFHQCIVSTVPFGVIHFAFQDNITHLLQRNKSQRQQAFQNSFLQYCSIMRLNFWLGAGLARPSEHSEPVVYLIRFPRIFLEF